MVKEVILMAEIDGLGAEGDVVRVSEGYARNYLLPRKLAAPVTEATRRQLEKKREERSAQRVENKAQAEAVAAALEKTSCTIPVKTGEEDKMFGSVTTLDIAAALKEQGIEVDRHAIKLDQPIKDLGVYEVKIKLQPDTDACVKVWVVGE